MSVKDIDKGWKRIRSELGKMSGAYTKVGVQQDAKRDDTTASAATIAAAHEYGTDTIPERSFLRSSTDESRGQINKLVAAEKDAIMLGRSTVKRSLNLIGLFMVGRVQAKIRSRIPPPLAPSTLARRRGGGARAVPLIDSGQMFASIRNVEVIGGREQ